MHAFRNAPAAHVRARGGGPERAADMAHRKRFRAARFVFAATLTLGLLIHGSFPPTNARADEGMWLPHALEHAPYTLWRSRGLTLDRNELFDPRGTGVAGAVVRVGGGTGSFVSAHGLIVTNHHVAAGALQRASSVESNYLDAGFLARTPREEIPARGYNAYVLVGVEDVTRDVLRKVRKNMKDADRYKAIENAEKRIVARAEKGKDIEADVRSVYGGSAYYLYTYFKIRDVRIVYAPPATVGVFGGETDNWMWPRHTGDFAFLRAYVSPNGKSADYSEDNVAYEPKKYLPFSTRRLEEGDFTMVIGYPGRTYRHRSSFAIDHAVNEYYPRAIQRYEDLIAILEDESEKSPEAKIKLASGVRGLSNGYKNNQGMLEGLTRYHLLEAKRQEEATLRGYLASHRDAADKYGDVLDGIAEQYAEYSRFSDQDGTLSWMLYLTSAVRSAYTVYKWSLEREKSDRERDPDYMPRDERRLKRRLELADFRYYEPADKRILKYFLMKAAAPESGRRLAVVEQICGDLEGEAMEDAIDGYIDRLYANTRVTDKNARMDMFGTPMKKLLGMKDPMIEFAAVLETEKEALKQRRDAFEGAMLRLRPRLIELRSLVREKALYPDANRTLRISTGEVKGYSPGDAVQYGYLTTLSGVIEKYTGEEPFDLPDRLVELHKRKNYGPYADPKVHDVPVDFLTTDDITGGNSGSAVLNGRGEIIGLAFDGNYEAISSDYQFLPELTRCIAVDSRYILFILDKFSDAQELLEELTIEWHVRAN